MPKINILLCGGGTGGHYYPLMAIKKELYSKSDFKSVVRIFYLILIRLHFGLQFCIKIILIIHLKYYVK